MDMERIKLILDVFHASLDVPHTDKIRAEIVEELKDWNNPPAPEPEVDEPELALERKL